MEINSGACSSLISKDFSDKMNLKIENFKKQLYTYNNSKIKNLGRAYLNVVFGNYNCKHLFYIINYNLNNICGQDLMPKVGKTINFYKSGNIINNFFTCKELPVKNFTAQILVKENAIPKVFKYRPIPIAYKEVTNKVLDDLVNKNFIEPVTHSDNCICFKKE